MGILTMADWQAKWIGAARPIPETLLLRREFVVKPGLKRALVNVCGLGQYELTLNGKKAGDDLLSPGWTKYDRTCLYDTRDITTLLEAAAKTPSASYWPAACITFRRAVQAVTKLPADSFGPLKAIAQIRLEYADGSVETIGTDEQLARAPGPITFCFDLWRGGF